MTNWIKELEQNLFTNKPIIKKAAAPPQPAPAKAQVQKPQQKSNDDGSLTLLFVFLLLCVMLTGAYSYKVNFTKNTPQQPIVVDRPVVIDRPVYDNNHDEIAEVKAKLNDLSSIVTKLADRTKINSDKIVLAGTILNHNTVVNQRNLPKTNYIYINSDWTINRMPDQLVLTPEDREFLQKFIK